MKILSLLAIMLIISGYLNQMALGESPSLGDWRQRASQMVDQEIVAAGVTNERVIQAARDTPRHEFVPVNQRPYAYLDMALPIGEGQTILRPSDLVARYGGDELVVVLPKTTLQEAMIAAQRIRKRIRTALFQCGDQTVRITISMGIAQCPASLIKTPEDLFRLADQALYAAKKKGRNRIESPPLSAVGAGESQIDGIRR